MTKKEFKKFHTRDIDEMAKGTEYKKIYQLAKERVEAFAEAVGRSSPGESRKVLQG